MKVVAIRGVCIGVDRHLVPGEEADLDVATVRFLAGIGAVREVAEAPAEARDAATDGQADSAPKGAKAPKKGP